MIDAHVHVVDFLQRGFSGDELIAALDRAGVERAVVFGLPVKKIWPDHEPREPDYYLDDNAPCIQYALTDRLVGDLVESLDVEQQRRVAPLACGFDPTDRLAASELERVWDRYPFWRGVGELLLRHDDLTNMTYGEPGRINCPALDEVFEFCRDHDCPMSVHQDASTPGRPREREYMVEMLEALDRHPRTTVVWCHAGADRRVNPEGYAEMVGRLIERYERLHIDLSWVLIDKALCPGGEPDPDWVRLIGTSPERFVLGSDTVGRLDAYEETIRRLDPLLEALDPAVRDLVADGNAARLWFGE